MVKKRDRFEIIYNILSIIRDHHNSIRVTPLLRKANISSQSFGEYYRELVAKEFIREVETAGNKYISLTDKGFNYLAKYKAIIGFIEEFEL